MYFAGYGQGGLRLAAISGLDSAVVAWDVPDPAARGGLVGFTAYLYDNGKGKGWFLKNHRENGSSHRYPLQRFRWSVFGLRPGGEYVLYVWPVFASTGLVAVDSHGQDRRGPVPTDAALARAGKLTFSMETNVDQPIQIYANRGTYAVPSAPRLPASEGEDGERRYLGRGIDEVVASFVTAASEHGQEVCIAAYELDDPKINEAVGQLKAVRLIYDGLSPSAEHSEVIKQITKSRRKAVGAKANVDDDFVTHNKFIVARDAEGRPAAVLTGSTDFSTEGFFCQANNLMIFHDPALAGFYQDRFDLLWGDEGKGGLTDRKAAKAAPSSKGFVTTQVAGSIPVEVSFAPHAWAARAKTGVDFARIVALIGAAKQSVFFAETVLDEPMILKALKDAADRGVTVFGLVDDVDDSGDDDTPANMGFVTPGSLEAAQTDAEAVRITSLADEALPDWAGGGDVRIHHKLLVIDAGTPGAVTIGGSEDLTVSSSKLNDENLVIVHDQRVADICVAEVVRLYDTYRFRAQLAPGGQPEQAGIWWQAAYEGAGDTARSLWLPEAKVTKGSSGVSGRARRAAIRKAYYAKRAEALAGV